MILIRLEGSAGLGMVEKPRWWRRSSIGLSNWYVRVFSIMSSPRNIGLYSAAVSDFLAEMLAYRFAVLVRRRCAPLISSAPKSSRKP